MQGVRLPRWARDTGISYQTAWRMWRDGRLPFRAVQLPTGTIIVYPEAAAGGGEAGPEAAGPGGAP